jgi:hypothetical protein
MKYLLVAMVLLLSGLLTACSGATTTPVKTTTTPASVIPSAEASPADTGLLEEFVYDVNTHQITKALDLFYDSAEVTESNQVGLGTTLPTKGSSYTYSGKAQIEEWLNSKVAANLQVVPVDYQTAVNVINMNALFYYTDQVHNIKVFSQIQDDRFTQLYFVIEQIKPVPLS